MKLTPKQIEEKFSEVPESGDRVIQELYYLVQRKFVSLAWSLNRELPESSYLNETIEYLEKAYDQATEAIFRKLELKE